MESQVNQSANSSDREKLAEQRIWRSVASVISRWKFIGAVTTFAAIASIIIALLLPLWYQGVARVLLPESSGGGGFSAMMGDLGPAAMSILGGGGGDYVRYQAILSSRTTLDETVEKFNLEEVYELTDPVTARADAIEILSSNLSVEVDRDYEFLSIAALDKDPERARDMANHLVEELNRKNAQLASANAANYRKYIEERYQDTEIALDSARVRLQRLQEKHGIIELETQAEAFLTLMADYRAAALQGEIEYEGLAGELGKDNYMAKAARERVMAAKRKQRDLTSGADPVMPVSIKDLPAVSSEYANLLQDVMINANILELSRPLLEQALFDEKKEAPSVQVLDRAITPVRKAKPKRSVIVMGVTLSAFILAILYVLFSSWWKRNRAIISDQLTAAAH